MSAAEGSLQPDDYLWPLSTLRDTLLKAGSADPSPKLCLILKHHVDRLRTPWRLAKSNAKDGPNVFSQPTVSPAPGVQVDIDEPSRALASKLADVTGIAGVDACLIVKSYTTFVDDAGDVQLEQLFRWYSDECLALADIVLEILHLYHNGDGEWMQMASEIKEGMMPDAAEYMKELFKGWAGLAQQKSANEQSGHALFWASHQLRLQSVILDILFLVLYQNPTRPVSISEGLIRGFMMSSFATEQANRDIWEMDTSCQRLALRIRDLALVIVLEAFGLSGIVTPGEESLASPLLTFKESITSLHLFLYEYTAQLEPTKEAVFPTSPTPLISLAWSIFLRSLVPTLLPPPAGSSGQLYQDMASRALAPSSGLFPWIEQILIGPLFTSTPDRSETFRRKVLKDLLIGLADIIQLANTPDRLGLYRIWDLLFSTGSPSTSLALSADYWIADHPSPLRRALLDQSDFPHNPTLLPYILSSLSGVSAEDATEGALDDVRPVQKAAEYFSNLDVVVIPTQPGWYRFLGKDAQGRMRVEAARNLVLPGGNIIEEGQHGTVLRTNGEKQIVAWETRMPGWKLLIEIMKVALGARTMTQQDLPVDNSVCLSVADLEISVTSAEVIGAGLRLLACVLRPIGGLANEILGVIPAHPVYTILELVFPSLQQNLPSTTLALDILVSLLHVDPAVVFGVLRSTGFFGVPGRKRGLAYNLIHLDSAGGTHEVTLSVLRLVSAMVSCSFRDQADDGTLRAAIHHTFADVWPMFAGWRYADSTRKYMLASSLCELYESVLSHPSNANGLTPAAQTTIDVLISSSSTITYRPIVELLTQGPVIAQRLAQTQETAAVVRSVEAAISLLSALFRVATVDAGNLPFSLFASTATVDSEKISLVDALARIAVSPATQTGIRIGLLKLIQTYLDSTALDHRKASLAGLLGDAELTCAQLAVLAGGDASSQQRAAAWNLLASVITTQPGCASACIGAGPDLAPPLESALAQITARDPDLSPQVLSSALAFCQAALLSPSASSSINTIRGKKDFWKSVFEIATTSVAIPPTFQLSIHSPDFASRITIYAHATQARANATSLLAAELRLLDEDDQSEALDLVLGAWRSGDRLEEMAAAAMHSSCEPELQDRETKRLEEAGVKVERWRSTRMAGEREYGMGYLYDGNPQANEAEHQSMVNLGMDLLNLDWSMLEGDVALTRAFRELAEGVASWAEGDGLAAKAAMQAAIVVGDIASQENRAGDILLAVQTERLSILSTLLQIALADGVEVDNVHLDTVSVQVRNIINSPIFDPISSMRHPQLPAIHRPALRILQSLFIRLALRPMTLTIEVTIEVGASFILEAADIALDAVSRGIGSPSDFALSITPLCDMIGFQTTVWLDKLSSSNLIMRSLELVNRIRIQSDSVPAYLPSVLLLHLALANHPYAAEKLAVSGLLPTYSDNAIATEAEYGRITPDLGEYSVHSAWCGMILVVKTVLASLPETATFVQSDVVPFLRLTTAQTIRSLSWDADSPLSLPAIQEMRSTAELFHAVSSAIGANISLLADFSSAALPLLVSIRYALNHPRLLSTQLAPSTEEEQSLLQKELEHVESQQEVVLLDFAKTPILASRTAELINVTRTILLTFIGLTGASSIMKGIREVDDGLVIHSEDEVLSSPADPVGIITDFQSLATTLCEKMSANTAEGAALLQVCHQLAEAGCLLSASQILLRRVLLPVYHSDEDERRDDEKPKGRVSLGSGSERDRAEGLLRELEADWREIIDADGAVGSRALGRWLEDALDRTFEEVQE